MRIKTLLVRQEARLRRTFPSSLPLRDGNCLSLLA
jgi:hypothetical protein